MLLLKSWAESPALLINSFVEISKSSSPLTAREKPFFNLLISVTLELKHIIPLFDSIEPRNESISA